MKTLKRSFLVMSCLYGTIFVSTTRCSNNEDPAPVDCNTVNIELTTTKVDPTGCSSADGRINSSATGGQTPYQYSINGGSFGDDNVFNNLSVGSYTITVMDRNGCEKSEVVSITSASSNLAFTAAISESGCKTNEGSITVTAIGGSSTYEYRLNDGNFGTSNLFNGLGPGNHTITVRDSEGCITSQSVALSTGVTYQDDIKGILDANCATSGCHVTGGGAPMSLQTYAIARSRAADIKNSVLNNTMPKGGPPLSQALKDKIACWVDDNAPEN